MKGRREASHFNTYTRGASVDCAPGLTSPVQEKTGQVIGADPRQSLLQKCVPSLRPVETCTTSGVKRGKRDSQKWIITAHELTTDRRKAKGGTNAFHVLVGAAVEVCVGGVGIALLCKVLQGRTSWGMS